MDKCVYNSLIGSGNGSEADLLWAFTDVLSAVYVLITIFIIVAKHKEIFRLFDDFWHRYLPAKERGENPPYVSFDCHEEE